MARANANTQGIPDPAPTEPQRAAAPESQPAGEAREQKPKTVRLAWNIDAHLDGQLRTAFDEHLGVEFIGKYAGWSQFGTAILREFLARVEASHGQPLGESDSRYPTGRPGGPRDR